MSTNGLDEVFEYSLFQKFNIGWLLHKLLNYLTKTKTVIIFLYSVLNPSSVMIHGLKYFSPSFLVTKHSVK